MRTAYLRFETRAVEKAFDDDKAAVAFARRMTKQMCFWDFTPGAFLEVRNEEGDVIAQFSLRRPPH